MTSAKLDNLQQIITEQFPGLKLERRQDAIVVWPELASFRQTMQRFHDEPGLDFKLLIDVAGVHYPHREQPFEVVYQLLSVHRNHRLRVKLDLDETTRVPSVISVWRSANWYEREVYEMFGLLFSDHPDLRRLLTEYDFDAYPLRKDFPVEGYTEVRYDAKQRRVVREPVCLSIPNREYYG